jgi:hypothetical protein
MSYDETIFKEETKMSNVKEFCKKHKKGIILTGVVAGVVIGAIAKTKFNKRFIDVAGKNWITWKSGNTGYMDLERVKEILDLNANNSEPFAIFRAPSGPTDYTCIQLSENLVLKAK